MARPDPGSTIRLSLLDDLLDDEPESSRDPQRSEAMLTRQLRDSVRRDLQNLLNTRQRCLSWPRELSELNGSVINYGIPDITGANLAAKQAREDFLDSLSGLIRSNDPRFKSVKTIAIENSDPLDRTLRFRIEAILRVETGAETVTFDFELEPVRRNFESGPRQ